MLNKKKQLGQVFTPTWIVDLILERLDYKGSGILDKYIFEPGCGDGNFLEQIIKRYIEVAKKSGKNSSKIERDLKKYIYAVEIDKEAYDKCLIRLNNLLSEFKLSKISWNIYNKNILDLDVGSLPKFDYVIGNPPYVRIHNLNKSRLSEIKERFDFCKKGIIDLFLVFFEIGILSLSENGKLGFITPNSFIHNSTYGSFRTYLKDKKMIKELINFKENSVFEDASTYNAITILDNKHDKTVLDYYEYLNGKIVKVNTIDLNSQNLKKWNFTNNHNNEFLGEIKNKENKIADIATVQYGFATLRDRLYIIDEEFNQKDLFKEGLEGDLLHPVVKGSRYNGKMIKNKIIFPYILENGTWKVIPEKDLKEKYPNTYRHFIDNKKELEQRSLDKGAVWYEYGRSQGVQTVHNEKLVISPIFKDEIKVFKIDEKTMVYSGIYIFSNKKSEYSLDYIMKRLKSDEFKKYANILGKDMRGGYKNINTRIIKEFSL